MEGSAEQQCSRFSVLPFLATTQLTLFPQAASASQPVLLDVALCDIILTHQVSVRWINLALHPAAVWTEQPRCCELRCTARPLGVSGYSKATWLASKAQCTMAHVVRFPGNGLENSGTIVPGIIIPLGPPLAVVRQATRRAEKVFHWALIEKMPPWIQQMPVSCMHAQSWQSCWR